MEHEVVLQARIELPSPEGHTAGRSGFITKTIKTPFSPTELPEGFPMTVDNILPEARVQQVRYVVPSGMFVVRVNPIVRAQRGETADEFKERVTAEGWTVRV